MKHTLENLTYQPFSVTINRDFSHDWVEQVTQQVLLASGGRAHIHVNGRTLTFSNLHNVKAAPDQLFPHPQLFDSTIPVLVRGDAGSIFYWRIMNGEIQYKQAVILPADFAWVGTESAVHFLELSGMAL